MSTSDITTKFENYDAVEMLDDDSGNGGAVTLATVEREHYASQVRASAGAHEIANAPERARRDRQRRARDADTAERVAASGGENVRTELSGGVGQAVAEVLRLDRIADAARKIAHRVDEEAREAHEAMQRVRHIEHLDGLLSAAWEDASAKRKVSPVLEPHLAFVDGQQHLVNPDPLARSILATLSAQHAQKAHARLIEALDDVDAVLVESAERTLTAAGSAADTLAAAGVSLDASAEDVLAHGGDVAAITTAFTAWRDAVTEWGEVQSARRWVFIAYAAGFEPTDPERLADGDYHDFEVWVWGQQFAGSSVGVGVGVRSARDALVWWTENGRPAPTGVGIEKAGAEQ